MSLDEYRIKLAQVLGAFLALLFAFYFWYRHVLESQSLKGQAMALGFFALGSWILRRFYYRHNILQERWIAVHPDTVPNARWALTLLVVLPVPSFFLHLYFFVVEEENTESPVWLQHPHVLALAGFALHFVIPVAMLAWQLQGHDAPAGYGRWMAPPVLQAALQSTPGTSTLLGAARMDLSAVTPATVVQWQMSPEVQLNSTGQALALEIALLQRISKLAETDLTPEQKFDLNWGLGRISVEILVRWDQSIPVLQRLNPLTILYFPFESGLVGLSERLIEIQLKKKGARWLDQHLDRLAEADPNRAPQIRDTQARLRATRAFEWSQRPGWF